MHPVSAPGSVLAQDIPDRCLTTSRTDVAGHAGRLVESRSFESPLPTAPVHPRDRLHRRPKAGPGTDRSRDTHDRVRSDRVDQTGCVSLRVNGRLHHIGIGRTHTGTHVLLLVQDLHVRVIDAATGELLRELTIDPTRDYQPTGRPPGPAPKKH